MHRLSLLVLASFCFGNAAAGGVSIGGSLPPGIISKKMMAAQRLTISGQLKAVRWVAQTGRSVTQSVSLPVGSALTLDAPAGEWTDVVLLFSGDVVVTDGAHLRTLSVPSLEIALDEPLLTTGAKVELELDLTAPDGLWSEDAPSLADGATGRVIR